MFARRDLKRRLTSGHRLAVRQNAVGLNRWLEEERSRGQRVLDGLSGARAGGRVQAAIKASITSSVETGIWSITAMIS